MIITHAKSKEARKRKYRKLIWNEAGELCALFQVLNLTSVEQVSPVSHTSFKENIFFSTLLYNHFTHTSEFRCCSPQLVTLLDKRTKFDSNCKDVYFVPGVNSSSLRKVLFQHLQESSTPQFIYFFYLTESLSLLTTSRRVSQVAGYSVSACSSPEQLSSNTTSTTRKLFSTCFLADNCILSFVFASLCPNDRARNEGFLCTGIWICLIERCSRKIKAVGGDKMKGLYTKINCNLHLPTWEFASKPLQKVNSDPSLPDSHV